MYIVFTGSKPMSTLLHVAGRHSLTVTHALARSVPHSKVRGVFCYRERRIISSEKGDPLKVRKSHEQILFMNVIMTTHTL